MIAANQQSFPKRQKVGNNITRYVQGNKGNVVHQFPVRVTSIRLLHVQSFVGWESTGNQIVRYYKCWAATK